MKFLKKRPVAIAVMVLAIVLSIGIGWFRHEYGTNLLRSTGLELDESLDTAYYGQFIYDQADVLGSSAEKKLALYNANWDARYNRLTAFVSVYNVDVDAEEYAHSMAAGFHLGAGDALLLVVKDADTYRFVFGDDFGSIMNAKVQDRLASAMDGGKWEDDVLDFYAALNQVFTANFGEGNGTAGSHYSRPSVGLVGFNALVVLVILAVIVVLLLSAIDRSRYNTYRARYYGVANPPVVFRPILFWHGPGTAWYRRGWHQPPPPPPPGPRGPGGFGGPGPGGSGGTRPSGGSGGFGGAGARGPRGTGFNGGGSFGGTRGSSPRPGSFGGSSFGGGSFGGSRGGSFGGGSFGGSRGGSFGGSRGGSFGGSRGGSFGGSRGGGFGGSRGGGFGGSRGGGFGGKR